MSKVYCTNCANYAPNRGDAKSFSDVLLACTVIKAVQVEETPLYPAHVEQREYQYSPLTKNKNNNCPDFILYRAVKDFPSY